ncbi:MerR family transcriptional regulator [Staphylococcus haemolyticus]|uniref:MerR family transcriptional regulator n=1 Tax=Staphylococcus haemolyticus TaxID=1283 RepID=UPI00069EDECC|nr:MerR family transcriptional regulator [Staphylococcus haemolyticus]
MNTKEVVEFMGLSQDTLRYYEKVGAIPTVERNQNGYRDYRTNDLNWIYLVKNLRLAGVKIELLIEFCKLGQLPSNEDTQQRQKEILNEQLSELDAKLEVMHKARNLLKYKIDAYDSHLAQFNAGELSKDNVDKLWEKPEIVNR